MKIYTVIPTKSNFGHDHSDQPLEAYRTRRAAEARAKELGTTDLGDGHTLSHRVGEVYLEDGISKAERGELLAEFQTRATALFAEHPLLTSFSFRLYTDYFNDGSDLQYRRYAHAVNGEEEGSPGSLTDSGKEWVRDPRGWQFSHTRQARPEGPLFQVRDQGIDALLSSFDDDQLKAMFGDHVEVTVTPGGHEVAAHEDHE